MFEARKVLVKECSFMNGAKFLTPIFKHAPSWQVLEFIVGWTMLFLAITLVI